MKKFLLNISFAILVASSVNAYAYGIGIDEEDPNIIFEPFYTTKVTGVGLGLANVKRIIKEHNGEIEVKNNDDKGVELKIRLPIIS